MSMLTTSTNNMLSIKVVLISTSVLSAAFMLSTTDIAVYVPWIYNAVVSLLRPPYLYLLINCIIITIAASSKLHSTTDHVSSPQQPVQTDLLTPTTEFNYQGVEKKFELDAQGRNHEDSPPIVGGADDPTSNKENECVVAAKLMWSISETCDATNYVKPPASVRFSHRRNSKSSPQGGRTVLGVSKPKKQDTMENTWKAIREGRSIRMSRHLKKSDTWERENTPPGSTATRKEASLSHDELNRRVEAFINKFNEEMRLQRQESLKQYTQMVTRGSH